MDVSVKLCSQIMWTVLCVLDAFVGGIPPPTVPDALPVAAGCGFDSPSGVFLSRGVSSSQLYLETESDLLQVMSKQTSASQSRKERDG